jgi:flagellin-like hook-associated protein FlgL
MMAMNTARNLNNTYGRLASSVERLSSGLRINSAADDAAGLAIRELMRADISTMQQGIRNAADAISMIQTADGGMAVIDEKLTRMKELAEQAATGTYTTLQREIINSEYQAMAAEIDRIATATNFNGVKLLDGSITNLHGGLGMKIHFGVGNNADEDYYFINTGDVRATSSTGLRIGGDAKNDIWGQGAAGAKGLAGPGCCTAGYDTLDKPAGFVSGQTFSYGYNWDWIEDDDPDLLSGKYLAGRYTVTASDSLQDLIDKVNRGTQSRVGVELDSSALAAAIKNGGTAAVCVGDEAYIFGSASVAGGTVVIPAVEGVVYKYLVEGEYKTVNFAYNSQSGYGFGLTKAQIQYLSAAGIDYTKLNLHSASVTGSASSTVSSAQAKTELVKVLSRAFNALNLSSLSSMTTVVSATTGFTMSPGNFLASANGTILSGGVNASATIATGQTLKVHTGVYADQYGNWTDDKRIASALGLEEVLFEFKNSAATYQTTAPSYTSDNYRFNGTDLLVDNSTFSLATGAGLDLTALLGLSWGSVTGPFTGQGATSDQASADLLAKINAAWVAEYGIIEDRVEFTINNGSTAAGPTATQISALSASFTAVTNTIPANATLRVETGIWVDSLGNWTDSAKVATALNSTTPNTFNELVYTFTANGGGTEYTISITSGTGTITPITGDPFAASPYAAATLSVLSNNITASIQSVILAAQGANPTTEGFITFNPSPASPGPVTAAQVDAIPKTPVAQLPDNLSINMTMAGATSAVSNTVSGPLYQLPDTTKISDLVAGTMAVISQALLANQTATAALGTYTNMGRIVLGPVTTPSVPGAAADLSNVTVTPSIYSGVLDRSVATGYYDDNGYLFNSSTGYGLTSGQSALLHKANLDLSKLMLASAKVLSSAYSSIDSAEAKILLLDKLNQLWDALALNTLSALTIASGVTTGFTPLDDLTVALSAIPGVTLVGNGGTATIGEQKSLIVHTGIYSDANGNWTDDKALADDLGLTEIIYTFTNNDYTSYKYSASYTSPDYRESAGFVASQVTIDGMTGSGGITWPTNFLTQPAQIIGWGSAANSAIASAMAVQSAQALWIAKYSSLDAIVFDSSDNGSGIAAITLSALTASADPTATPPILNSYGSTGTINPGQTLTVHTGIWADGNGNWANAADSAIAKLFGLSELVYTFTADAAGTAYTFTIPTTPTGTDPSFPGTSIPTATLDDLAKGIDDSIQYILSRRAFETSNDAGKISIDPVKATLLAPTATQLTVDGDDNTTNPNALGFLDATITIAGSTVDVFIPNPPSQLPVTTDMAALATALNTDLTQQLADAQLAAILLNFNGMGLITKAAPRSPSGPSSQAQIEELTVEDIYKQASNAHTVTTTGIIDKTKHVTLVASAGTAYFNASGVSNFGAWALASAINHNADSQFWAMVQKTDSAGNPADMVYIFAKEGGDNNSLLACDVADGDIASQDALLAISFENTESGKKTQDGTSFTLGGQDWAKFKPIQTKAGHGNEVWNLTLHGRDVGAQRDLWIAAISNGANEIVTPGMNAGIINGLDRYSFVEIQNAADGPWTGAEVRTQSSAQEALEALNEAMERKDKVRADIGALQNRLENTITNLEIQVESLQASESRISDVDVATEMTEFVRNQVLAQAAVSMLSQANSLPQMALSLLNG